MNVAFLSLGGNMGNRAAHLSEALETIEKRCGRLSEASSVYETAAWGSDSANAYLNQVVRIETGLHPRDLLNTLLDIEKKAGRTREGGRYADRVIDLDLLFYNNEVIDEKDLQIPHPRLHLRQFVLVPMVELQEGLVHPVLKRTMRQLLDVCTDTLSVKKYQG